MKAAIAVCFLFAAVVLARPDDKKEEKYTDRYDNINLDDILNNEKILANYMECCLDRGKCTPDGKELKSHIQDALETNCKKCTDTQRQGTQKIMKHLINKKPTYWAELTAKYDPTGKYAAEHEKELKELKKE